MWALPIAPSVGRPRARRKLRASLWRRSARRILRDRADAPAARAHRRNWVRAKRWLAASRARAAQPVANAGKTRMTLGRAAAGRLAVGRFGAGLLQAGWPPAVLRAPARRQDRLAVSAAMARRLAHSADRLAAPEASARWAGRRRRLRRQTPAAHRPGAAPRRLGRRAVVRPRREQAERSAAGAVRPAPTPRSSALQPAARSPV